jgi:5-methylcytosine-specific restriction protein A
MPRRAASACSRPGCPGLVRDGVCSTCGPRRVVTDRRHDAQRGTAAQRGYGGRWQRVRLMYLRANPLCVECAAQGRTEAATDVDHIVARRNGGTDDWDNLQSMCHSCHSRKTAGERQPQRRGRAVPTVMVCGPMGSGKTTYVNQRKHWGDLVLDVDALFVALSGGMDWYDKPAALLPYVMKAMDAVIARLCQGDDDLGRAWVITSEADAVKRQRLAQRLGASVVVLDVSASECLRRIAADPRRADKVALWQPLIARWWDEYQPADGETTIRG